MSQDFAFAMGQELKAVGINLDYAPCIDTFTNPKNTIIGDRAIGSDPYLVAKHSTQIILGFRNSDIISCAKHFPGHGNTLLDSHFDLPVEQADLKRLQAVELIPFQRAIETEISLIMSAHILFPNIDPEWPATLSEIFLKNILREQLGFRGLVITDDLGMKALAARYSTEFIPIRALQAGVDLLLYCNEPDAPAIALEALHSALAIGKLNLALVSSIHTRVLNHKREFIRNLEPLPISEMSKIVGCQKHLELAKIISAIV
jgi:beta-N-acetylhexosaminidase